MYVNDLLFLIFGSLFDVYKQYVKTEYTMWKSPTIIIIIIIIIIILILMIIIIDFI